MTLPVRDNKDQPVYALIVVAGGPKMKPAQPDPAPAADPATKPPAQTMTMPTLQGNVKMSRSATGIVLEMPDGEIVGRLNATVDRGNGSQPVKLHLDGPGMSMHTFAELLSVGVVDRPVVDKTGLTGNYDVTADITEFDAMNVVRASLPFIPMGGGGEGGNGPNNLADPSGSAIVRSVEKLGLKLDPRKLPLEMLVIDHMEKTPTEN